MNVCYKTLLWIFENFCLRLSYFCCRKPWYSFNGMMDQWRTFMLTCRCCLSTRSSYTALWGCMRRESSGSPVVVVGYLEPLWRKSKKDNYWEMSLRTLSRLLKAWYREIFIPFSLIDNRQIQNAWSYLKSLGFISLTPILSDWEWFNFTWGKITLSVILLNTFECKKKKNHYMPYKFDFYLYFLQRCNLDWFVHFQCQLSGTYSALSPPLDGATAGQQRILQHDCVSKITVNL